MTAVTDELQMVADEARRYAGFYPEASDGRNTFIIFAEWVERRQAALSLPVSNTGENAELVKRLLDICENDDHARGCRGREYDCSCGFDERTFATAKEAATAIAAADARIAELEAKYEELGQEAVLTTDVLDKTADGWMERCETAETLLEEARRALRAMFCPRPCNGRPDDFDAGDCVDAGECGCAAIGGLGVAVDRIGK